jgi:hypothetical protein
MFVTIILSLLLIGLTLLSTTFHLPHLSLLALLVILIFRQKGFVWLLSFEAFITYLFGHISLGVSLLLITAIVGVYLWSRENIFPGQKVSSLFLALAMVAVWEVTTYLLF